MSQLSLDRTLALLLVAMAATGLLTIRVGDPAGDWVFTAHGVLGGMLLAAVVVKLRRSLPKAVRVGRSRRLALGLLLSGVTLATVTGGFLAVASGALVVAGPWTLISWHAAIGLLLLPVVVLHLLPRRWRILRPRNTGGVMPGRRSLLFSGALGVAGVALWGTANLLDVARGGQRRFTGSRWLPSGTVPPSTTFLGEGVPTIDAEAWRLTVSGLVTRPGSWSAADLARLPQRSSEAVLDCTSGWAIETTWSGVSLGDLLELAEVQPDARRVDIRAITGWGAALGVEEARGCLLATSVAGQPLPAGNGAPCRLVVPGRRGLDWVKWVTEIHVS